MQNIARWETQTDTERKKVKSGRHQQLMEESDARTLLVSHGAHSDIQIIRKRLSYMES